MNTRHLVPVALLTVLLAACGSEPSAPKAHEEPAAAAPSREAPPASAKLALSGTITYDGPVTGTSLFVSVKDPKKPGPPLAAKQLPPGPFPLTFTLTDADVVQMGPVPRPIPEKVALTVRLDADGDAMSKAPGEPVATLETPATSEVNVALSVAK